MLVKPATQLPLPQRNPALQPFKNKIFILIQGNDTSRAHEWINLGGEKKVLIYEAHFQCVVKW
jgi:hypothetical protein